MSLSTGTHKYVSLSVKPERVEVKNGKSFALSVFFAPSKGIHINASPAVTVTPGDSCLRLSVGEVRKSGDYLDTSSPLRLDCRLDGMKPGTHRVGLVLNYTYCSDDQGWCRMAKDEVSVELHVKE